MTTHAPKAASSAQADFPSISAPSRCERVVVRDIEHHVRRWGDPGARPLLMLHGARDCAATFQFVVDAFQQSWNIAAPDWRGHGGSTHAPGRYWVHDFLADLDALADALFPGVAFDLVGHSMGGNVASLYAGLRPQRVRRFVSLDALGPPAHRLPVDVHATLDALLRPAPVEARRGFDRLADVVSRLVKANRRLTPERADFMARHSTRRGDDGRYRWLFDASFKRSLPTLHTLEEWASIWAQAQAPTLWIGASDARADAPFFDQETVTTRLALHERAEYRRLGETGHNLHHDRPGEVAWLIEEFLMRPDPCTRPRSASRDKT